MKPYTGSPAAARHYVEADRSRADDYYLAEGTGVAERYVASPDTGVRRMSPLTGDSYEAWVAGLDPDTGRPKGRLRQDDRAVRFVEVTVNGPKSWSLAAELHPDISAAYDGAQDRAATQIIGWLAQHATTRVGPRGGQVQVPVEALEAVTVRHYTSRAGDPHRHLHLQINARVFAAGQWRGLHTVGVRDSLNAINGIGHAAVATDPAFRAALAAHGFSLDAGGEIMQLAPYVGAFSRRAAQIGRNIDRYEADWRAAHPGQEPGPGLWRAWDARAWAEQRPDKITPEPGAEVHHRWLGELSGLGYRDPDTLFEIPLAAVGVRVGELDREQAVGQVLARLGAGRSAWNAADVRGEVEQLIAREGIVVEAGVRGELAEDLTARAVERCVPLLHRDGVPEHIRALTSRHVLDVECDIAGRLAVRGADGGDDIDRARVAPAAHTAGRDLDAGQREAIAALAGDRSLVLIEGAAGAGKTTTLAATRELLTAQGHALVVVTPTLKAAKAARVEVGARAGSAAWLAFQHGWRWDGDGTWTRLVPGQPDPVTGREYTGPGDRALLRAGELLVVDEAGMLDQDTARALLTIADEHRVRVALLGDRHQLSAVGRGGVLDLAHRWADPEACLTLDVVHRFTHETATANGTTTTVPDHEYAALTVAMRAGQDPGDVFDALHARGQLQLHPSEADRQAALADTVATQHSQGVSVAVVADTRDQVGELNAAIRERLVAIGCVDDSHVVTTRDGVRIGAGDQVATRRNDRELDVANRDTWTVTRAHRDGRLTVTSPAGGDRALPADYVERHIELGYAATAHGVQGDTVTTAHLVLGEHTGAASAYVGMTRGREANLAHLVAENVEGAREQWVAVFARDRADLGPAHAAELAAQEAARYAELRPPDEVFAELHRAWTVEEDCLEQLTRAERRREMLADVVALTHDRDATAPALKQAYQDARVTAERASARAASLDAAVSAHATQIADSLQREWDEQRNQARHAAQIVRDGSGRLGQRRSAVNRATEDLARWSANWQPYLQTMPTRSQDVVAFAAWFDDTPRIRSTFEQYARAVAEHARPEYGAARADADTATRHRDESGRAWHAARAHYDLHLSYYGSLAHHLDPTSYLAEVEQRITATRTQADSARTRVASLLAEPTIGALPVDQITAERDTWRADRDTHARNRLAHSAQLDADQRTHYRPEERDLTVSSPTPDRSPGISR